MKISRTLQSLSYFSVVYMNKYSDFTKHMLNYYFLGTLLGTRHDKINKESITVCKLGVYTLLGKAQCK